MGRTQANKTQTKKKATTTSAANAAVTAQLAANTVTTAVAAPPTSPPTTGTATASAIPPASSTHAGTTAANAAAVIQAAQAQIAEAQAAIAAAQPNAGQVAGDNTLPMTPVSKPKGSAGGGKNGFSLKDKMGLKGSHLKYLQILATVRHCAAAASINLVGNYKNVRHEDLARIFAAARKKQPYLARFSNDWATAEILKQFMRNVKRHAVKKAKAHLAANGGTVEDLAAVLAAL